MDIILSTKRGNRGNTRAFILQEGSLRCEERVVPPRGTSFEQKRPVNTTGQPHLECRESRCSSSKTDVQRLNVIDQWNPMKTASAIFLHFGRSIACFFQSNLTPQSFSFEHIFTDKDISLWRQSSFHILFFSFATCIILVITYIADIVLNVNYQ